jgi:hypothetical protein
MQRPCDELITRPKSPADCPRPSNRNEMESFMEAAKAQNWAVEPPGGGSLKCKVIKVTDSYDGGYISQYSN